MENITRQHPAYKPMHDLLDRMWEDLLPAIQACPEGEGVRYDWHMVAHSISHGGRAWQRYFQTGGTYIHRAVFWYQHVHKPGCQEWRPKKIVSALRDAALLRTSFKRCGDCYHFQVSDEEACWGRCSGLHVSHDETIGFGIMQTGGRTQAKHHPKVHKEFGCPWHNEPVWKDSQP